MKRFRLRERRDRLGLTQDALAKCIGCSAFVVSYSERVDSGHVDLYHYPTAENWIPKLREMVVYLELEKRNKPRRLRAEEERIAFQRSLWEALPDSPAKRALKAAMLDRALDLMHNSNGEATDAIAEFLPEADVDAMFAQWEREAHPEGETDEQAHEAPQAAAR